MAVELARGVQSTGGMSKDERKVRYAVIGAGNIAQVAVLPAFAHAKENSQLAAIISSDADKRAILRKQYDIDADGEYEELEAILKRADINAVYVTTPNALHKEYVLRAAAAGVHVLCEKPLANSVADCEAMIEACAKHGVKLMTAYRLHFDPATLEAIEIVKRGDIGEPRVFDSFFSHVVRPDDIRTKPELGGGAIYDLGVYCINAARNLFRAEPISVLASISKKVNGTDDTTSVILRFEHDRIAQFTVSNSTAGVSSYRIGGTKGDLRLEPGYEYVEGLKHYLTIDGKTHTEEFRRGDQFAPELVEFSRCILENREPEPSGEEGLLDIRVIEAVLQSAETQRPVELEPRQRARRPTIEQAMHKRPVGKQETVHAPSPGIK